MAIACLVLRAPCSPRRIFSISSRTNSPACVLGDFPSRLSSRARSMVRLSGMMSLIVVERRYALGRTMVHAARGSAACSGSAFAAEPEMIERIRAAAVDHEIERRDGPHQRVFEAELVPELA